MTYLLMDPIFGVNLDKTTQEFIKPQPITETSVALDRLDGVPLSGGNEGSLENHLKEKLLMTLLKNYI